MRRLESFPQIIFLPQTNEAYDNIFHNAAVECLATCLAMHINIKLPKI